MKKLILTTAMVLCMTLGAFAECAPGDGFIIFNFFNNYSVLEEERESQKGLFKDEEVNTLVWGDWVEPVYDNSLNYGLGGLFGRGKTMSLGIGNRRNFGLILPNGHGLTDDGTAAPVGSGIVMLLGMGGAYLVAKKRRKE